MECFYFTGAEYGIDNLKKKRLKVSNLRNLNDPFELLGINLSDKRTRRILHEVKDAVSERYGILCFSRNWQNPVQWGHYSDNHKGLCLVFDIPDDELKKIDYVASRIEPSSLNLESDETPYKLMTTKFKHWEYEKEYRAIYVLDCLDKEGELYFKPFDNDLSLKKVIIGCKSKITKEKVEKYVKNSVGVFYSRLHHSEFSIVKDTTK